MLPQPGHDIGIRTFSQGFAPNIRIDQKVLRHEVFSGINPTRSIAGSPFAGSESQSAQGSSGDDRPSHDLVAVKYDVE